MTVQKKISKKTTPGVNNNKKENVEGKRHQIIPTGRIIQSRGRTMKRGQKGF